MKIAILGYDIEGGASYDYFVAQGQHELTICDQNPDTKTPPGVATVLGDSYLDNLDRFDMVVRTPGLSPATILAKNPGLGGKIMTQTNEFLRICPTRRVIGVTGTKGKGTTSSLITRMLEAAGQQVWLGGNIGLPPLSFLTELDEDSWVVLELSSFQLIDLQRSPHIGVCLMIVPEHLNWHLHMEEYAQAKAQLFAHQTDDDIAIYFAENALSQQIAAAGAGRKIPYYESPGARINEGAIVVDEQTICQLSELKLLGAHNWQNACAAVTAVWQAGIHDIATIRSALTSFSGLPHRLALIQNLDGVDYYDDSFGTTPETAIVAVQAFSQPKVVILGGSDKGASYDELAKVVASSNVRQVLLIGHEAPRIQQALEAANFHNFMAGGGNMAAIVDTARGVTQAGDVVLLSTGCASFDMFENYKDRAQQFIAAVQSLA
jgi:UDP-N-acetylmuramoylalanine--D-glutamate ligase